MDALVARYGRREGERAYYAMEAEGRGPFGPTGKYRDLHEAWAAKNDVRPSSPIPGKKKPRPSKKAGAPKKRR